MGKLTASPAMIAGQAAQRQRKAEESPDVAAYQDQADERRSAKRAKEAAQRASFLKTPEGQAMLAREARLANAAAMLRKSDRWREVNSFTAMVRGMQVVNGEIKAMAPNEHVLKLFSPPNGKGQLITARQLLAAADYSTLNDRTKIGGASRDPAAIRVDGGGAGCTELAFLNRIDIARALKSAEQALGMASIVPEWASVIRELVDWVVLNGGQPIENFSIKHVIPLHGEKPEKACRAMLFRQGMDALCQHFDRAG